MEKVNPGSKGMKKEPLEKSHTDRVALSRSAFGSELLGQVLNLKATLRESMMTGRKERKVVGIEGRRKRHVNETATEAT